MNGDQRTGVSIMKIAPKKFDIGDVIAQKEINIRSDVLMPELHSNLAEEGAQLLLDCLQNVPDCLSNAQPQKSDEVTYGL